MLAAGGLVAFPTETVYGLGAVVTEDRAVARIFLAKNRPHRNPLIAHVADRAMAAVFAWFDERADRLAEAFWPGPLTLVLPRKQGVPLSPLVTAGLSTIAVRVPAHPVALRLIEETGLPVAAPSANRSGRVSPTRAEHVARDLGERVDLVLDAGPTRVGVESTILDLSRHDRIRLLRPGGISRERIELLVGPLAGRTSDEPARAPGLLGRHYAPRHPLRLDARTVRAGEGLLAFGSPPLPGARSVRNLSPRGDLAEAAANLFAMLRELDAEDLEGIAVMPIPRRGLGEAINDRLRRAAMPAETVG